MVSKKKLYEISTKRKLTNLIIMIIDSCLQNNNQSDATLKSLGLYLNEEIRPRINLLINEEKKIK